MVRDDLHQWDVKSEKLSGWADAQTQTEAPEEPAGLEPTQTPQNRSPSPTDRELDFLQWTKLSFEDEPESWQKVSPRSPAGDR